ncbi:MAG TPA: hypothetical protein VM536_21105 [Chloroflexia bacterium]|nr:hypothetical protein [Chloroflexia bacterium]
MARTLRARVTAPTPAMQEINEPALPVQQGAALRAMLQCRRLVHIINEPHTRLPFVITLIKAVHTLVFLGIGGCVLHISYAGLTNRGSRLTPLAVTVVCGESMVFFGNGRRCPLTGLAEAAGAARGTVGDIFLPDWFASRIPIVSSTLVVLGFAGTGLHRWADGAP